MQLACNIISLKNNVKHNINCVNVQQQINSLCVTVKNTFLVFLMYLPEDGKLLTIVSLNLHEQNQREDQLGKESLEKLFLRSWK